jgi:hypothetical protein
MEDSMRETTQKSPARGWTFYLVAFVVASAAATISSSCGSDTYVGVDVVTGSETNCNDGLDNDGDDLIDCADDDCGACSCCGGNDPCDGGDGDGDVDGDGDSDGDSGTCVSTMGQCQIDANGDGQSDWDRPIEERGWGGQLAWTPLDGHCVCPDGLGEDAVAVLSDGCVLPDADPSCTGGTYGSIENWAEALYGRRDVSYCTPVCWTPYLPR